MKRRRLFRCLKSHGDFSKGGYGFVLSETTLILTRDSEIQGLLANRTY